MNAGWTQKELAETKKYSHILAITQLLVSVTLLILPFIFILKYSLTLTILLFLSALISLIAGAFAILETRSETLIGAYLFSLIGIEYNLSVMILLVFWRRFGQDYYIAQDGQGADYMDGYSKCLYCIVPLVFFNSISMAYQGFATFIQMERKIHIRICVYVFAIANVILAAYLIHWDQGLILGWFIKLLSAILIVISIAGYIMVYSLSFNNMKSIGGTILILAFLLVSGSYLFFRQSESTNLDSQKQCFQNIRKTHESWILDQTKCSKYLSTFDCDVSLNAIKWEDQNQLVCLNKNCCNAFSDSTESYQYYASFCLFFLIINSFTLSLCLLQLDSQRVTQDTLTEIKRSIDHLFTTILVGVIIYAIIIMVQSYPTIPKESEVTMFNQIKVQQNKNPISYPSGIENVTDCQSLNSIYGKKFEIKAPSRVTVLTPDLQVVVTEYINSKDLSYLPQQLARKLLFPASKPSDGFVGVQGNGTDINTFLNENIQICGDSDKSKTKIDLYQLPKSSGRMLYHNHIHHLGVNQLTQTQKDYINKLQFKNLTIRVTDIKTQSPLNGVTLLFYSDDDDCGTKNSIPQREIKINSGQTIKNLVDKNYYFGAVKSGYYQFCSKFDLDQDLEINLIPQNTEPGQFTIVMETPIQKKFQLSLGASYQECVVGFFNDECGGMKFYGSQNAQAISVDQLAMRKYTFFVYFSPTDVSLKKLNVEKAQGKSVDTSKFNNDYIFDELKPVITLYAAEQDRQIVKYKLPQMKDKVKNEPNLTWIVLCVDGSIGDITQRSPKTFWQYAEDPQKYQRSINSKDMYPKVC
ncbi:hypothetical protein pb186bvf_009655 [Paramecium bursaria]